MNTEKRFTVDDVMAWGPCLLREQVAALFGRRKYMTVDRLIKLDALPAEDKLWCLLRPEVIPEKTLHALACDFAERALLREREAGREPDPRSWGVVEVKRLWINGHATDEELAAAWAAAWEAWAAAWEARAAAWEARAAAWEAARAAAWAAAGEAGEAWEAAGKARAAARAAAREAEREWQLARVIKLQSSPPQRKEI